MKDKYVNLIICIITLYFFFEIFDHTNFLINTFFQAIKLWFDNLLPTLFPFFIITDILSYYGFMEYIAKLFGNIMKLFKLPKQTSYILFMSLFSGFPGNSKLIKELLDHQSLTINDANKLLTFTHFSNPLFIIGTVGTLYLHNQKLALIILLVHYLTNIIIGLLFRNIYPENTLNTQSLNREKIPFIKLLTNSINMAFANLIIILGIIIVFSLFVNIMTINLKISAFNKSILFSFLEITKGLQLITDLSISVSIKATLITFFLSFGGISIHLQVMSILKDYKINYYLYFISRIMHASISSIIIYLII